MPFCAPISSPRRRSSRRSTRPRQRVALASLLLPVTDPSASARSGRGADMDRLLRALAPISDGSWAAIEAEAKSHITTFLAARKLVDLEGPHGWEHSANNLGRVETVPGPVEDVEARLRRVMPLVELRVPFTVSRAELDSIDRGAADTDFGSLDVATARLGLAENTVVFRGHSGAGIQGILDSR